jgi:hypothetical protein
MLVVEDKRDVFSIALLCVFGRPGDVCRVARGEGTVMARGRIIDREIFSHEILGELSLACRYLYHGIVVHADDEGRLKGSPKYLKAKIFPYDDIAEKDIKNMVDQLATNGFLKSYQVGTNTFLEHPHWGKWQPIRKDRFKPSDCPSSVDGQPLVNQKATTGIPLPNLTKPNLTKPNQSKDVRFERPSADEVTAYAKEISFDLDGQKFCDFYTSKGWLVGKSPMKDWKAAIRTWKKNNYGGSYGQQRNHGNGGQHVEAGTSKFAGVTQVIEVP